MKLRILPPPWRLIAIGVVFFAVIFFAHLPDHLILFPTKAPIDAGGAVRKAIPFQNGELELWTALSRRAQQQGRAEIYILRFYGNADRAERWVALEAEEWNNRAVESLAAGRSCCASNSARPRQYRKCKSDSRARNVSACGKR